MLGLREAHAHVSSRRSRHCVLRFCRRGCASTLRTSWHPARHSPHSAHDAAFERECRTAAQRYQQSAVIHKLFNLAEALIANPASNVVRLRRRAQTWRLFRLLERHWTPFFRQSLNLLRKLKVDVSVKK